MMWTKRFKERWLHKGYLRVHVYEKQGDREMEMYYDMLPNTLQYKDGRAFFSVGERLYYIDKGTEDIDRNGHKNLRYDMTDSEPVPILGNGREKLVDSAMLYISIKKEVLKAKFGRVGPESKLPYIIAVAAIVGMVVVVYIITNNIHYAVPIATITSTSPIQVG